MDFVILVGVSVAVGSVIVFYFLRNHSGRGVSSSDAVSSSRGSSSAHNNDSMMYMGLLGGYGDGDNDGSESCDSDDSDGGDSGGDDSDGGDCD